MRMNVSFDDVNDLTPTEFVLWVTISLMVTTESGQEFNYEEIEAMCGFNRKTISKGVQTLIAKDYIRKIHNGAGAPTYIILKGR